MQLIINCFKTLNNWSLANCLARIQIKQISWCFLLIQTLVLQIWLDHLKSTQNRNIPSKLTSTRYNVPWLSSKVKRMCRKKRRLYRKAKKSGSTTHKAAFKKFQNETRDTLRTAHWSYVNGILLEGFAQGVTKPFYGCIKAQRQDSQGVSPLRSHGQQYSDAASKARILGEQFKSVFTRDNASTADRRLPGPHFPSISPISVEPYGVQKLLSSVNPRKASGPDDIPARVLQCLATDCSSLISYLQPILADCGITVTVEESMDNTCFQEGWPFGPC